MTINAQYDFSDPSQVRYFLEEITRIPPWREVGTRNNPDFETDSGNTWANVSGEAVAAFVKDQWNHVWIKGGVDSGTNDTAIFYLPKGYRPSEKLRFPVETITTPSDGELTIDTDGSVVSSVGQTKGVGINVNFRI